MRKQTSPRGFRAWPENEERLRYAEKLGLNISDLMNELIEAHLRDHLMKKTDEIREALSAPVP